MEWLVGLLDDNTQTNTASFIVQTDKQLLYTIKVKGETDTRKDIARQLARIAKIPITRVTFMSEKRRKDKYVVMQYLVMHNDDMPPF